MKSALVLLGLTTFATPALAQQRIVAGALTDRAPGAQPNIQASTIPGIGKLFPLSSFFSIATNGNVGIGTDNPQTKLDVVGDVFSGAFRVFDTSVSSVGTQLIANLTSFVGAGPQMRFSGPGSGFIDIGQDNAGNFVVEGTDETRLRITNAGLMSLNFPIFNNVQFGTTGDFNFTTYSANDNTEDTFACGLFGDITQTTNAGVGAAVYGRSVDPNREALFAEGNTGATGTKSFVQPHPTDASKQIKFVCLEGNESGTYFRGKTNLVGGMAIIDVPADFRMVSEEENLTVQLTPMGNARVWLERYDLNQVVIRSTADIEVHYMVNGVRRGYADFKTIGRNTAYVPREPSEFGTQYPLAIRQMLVENGTLNPDFTPNLDTAARLGWRLDLLPKSAPAPTSVR